MLVQFDECGSCKRLNARKCAIFFSFVYIVASLIFIFSIIRTLDYPDYLLAVAKFHSWSLNFIRCR